MFSLGQLKKLSYSFINQFFNKYFFVFGFLISIQMVIFFAPELGLGDKDDFFLFKLFGVFRSTAFIYSTFFLAVLVILRSVPYFSRNRFCLNNIENLTLNISLLTVFLISCFIYLKRGLAYGFTAYELETVSNFSLVIKHLFNGVLENDFYTNAILNSPRIIIAKLLLIPTFLGIDWYSGIYFYKVIFQIIYLPLTFLIFYNVIGYFSPHKTVSKSSLWLTCLFILIIVSSETIINIQRSWDIAGFPSIFKGISATTKHTSLIIGLIFLNVSFSKNIKNKLFIGSILLAVCTLIHVLIGLAFFSIFFLFRVAKDLYVFDKHIILSFLIGIILPILFLLNILDNPNPLSDKEFIQIYVFETHPFHYKMSSILGWSFVFWACYYTIQLIITTFMKNIFLSRISLLSLAFFILPPVIQYISTEIFRIKFIAILGINRLSSFHSFLFCLNGFIIIRYSFIFNFFDKGCISVSKYIKNNINVKYLPIELFFFKLLTKLMKIRKSVLYVIMVICMIGIWLKTDHDPLESHYDKTTFKTIYNLCEYLKKSTPLDAVIFSNVDGNLNDVYINFALKIFGHRATFLEQAFPFSESYLREYMKRATLYNNYPSLNKKEIKLLKQNYNVTHFLVRDSKIFGYPENSYIWRERNLILFEVDKFFELM